MSLHRRLERLEALEGSGPDEQERERAARSRRAMRRLLHEVARARRQMGLEAGPIEPPLPIWASAMQDAGRSLPRLFF
jgi:hypothetical protein